MSTENILHFNQMIVKTAFCCNSHAPSSFCNVKLKRSTVGPRRGNTFFTWEPTYFINGITVFLWLMVKLWCEVNQGVSVVFKDTFFAAGHIKALQLIFLKLHLSFDHLGAVLSTVINTALTHYHLLKVLFVRKKKRFLSFIPTSSNTGPTMSVFTWWDETQRSTFLTNGPII